VLRTPLSVRPTKANRQRIAKLAARLPEHGHVLGWQPSGVWEVEDVAETASRAGLIAVLDAARDPLPPGPVSYTRIRSLGSSSQLGAGAIERIAQQLRGRRECFVVVDPQAAGRMRADLPAALGRSESRRSMPSLFRPGQPAALAIGDEEQ